MRSANRASCCYRGRDAGYPALPAQIRTCALTHPAPPSGRIDGQSLARPWVSDRQLRPVGRDQLVHLVPAVVGTMVWSACRTMYGVLRGTQNAANRSTSEQNTEMATARDGWDDVSREYPEALHQAAETLTDGGRRRRWKEETGWLRALISPAVGTNSRLGGNGRGCRRGDQNQRVGWTCHDEHWSESACATLTSALRRQESLRLKNLKNSHKNG